MRPEIIDPLIPLPLQQSQRFVDAFRGLGRDTATATLGQVGQAVVVQRKFGPLGPLRFTSRGPVWRPDAMPTDRVEALADARIHLLNADSADDVVLRSAGYRQIMTPTWVAGLALHRDPDRQMAQARVKWRNAARQLARRGMRIKQPVVDAQLLNWLLSVDALNQRRKKFRALPAALTRGLVGDGTGAHVLTAQQGNSVHAAMLFLRHGTTVTYHIGWTDARGRAASAHHALIIHAANWFAQRGAVQMDLGTVDTVGAPGLARFKIGSGAKVRALGGTWLRMPSWRG